MPLSGETRASLLTEIRRDLETIRREAEWLRAQAKGLRLPVPDGGEIDKVANQLWWAASELLDQSAGLEERLGMSAAAAAGAPDPHVQLRFLHEWLFDDLEEMDTLLGRIHNRSSNPDPAAEAVLSKAGAPMVEAYRTIVTAVDALVEDLELPTG
jgi:hypothetical protein